MPRHSSSSRRRRLLLHGPSDPGAPVDDGSETGEVGDRTESSAGPPRTGPATIPLRVNRANDPWRSELRRKLDDMQPLTWVFTGDGVTQAARHTDGRRGYVELFDARLRGGLRRLLDVVVNTGLEGGRIGTLSRNRDWRVERFRPDVVSLMVGFTDSTSGESGRDEFRETLRRLVDEFVEEGLVVVLNTPHRPDPHAAGAHADLPEYVAIVREIGDETGALLVDHWRHWKSVPGRELLAADGLHPNADGHAEMARLLQRELGLDHA